MRPGVDAGTLALYTSGVFDLHTRVKVENGSGTKINLFGRYKSYAIKLPDPNEPIGSLRLDFIREDTRQGLTTSLAPTVFVSSYNRLDDGVTYSPLLQLGRIVTFEIALTAVGGARPADGALIWYEVFQGYITNVNWPEWESRTASVTCHGLAGILQHQKQEGEHVYAAGTSIETVARQILDNNGFNWIPLYFPNATGKVIPNDYAPPRQKPVWEQIWELAQSMGWVAFFRYRGQNPTELTIFEPARTKTIADMTIDAHDYRAMEVDEAEVRNVGYLAYYDEEGVQQLLGPFVNNASITKYGGSRSIRRPFWIKLEMDSPIRSSAEATDMLNAALSDVSDPDMVGAALTFPLVFAESGVDLYTFLALDRIFDSNQDLAPFSVTIEEQPDSEPVSVVNVRGVPTAGTKSWSAYTGGAEAGLGNVIQISYEVDDTVTPNHLLLKILRRDPRILSVNVRVATDGSVEDALAAAPTAYSFTTDVITIDLGEAIVNKSWVAVVEAFEVDPPTADTADVVERLVLSYIHQQPGIPQIKLGKVTYTGGEQNADPALERAPIFANVEVEITDPASAAGGTLEVWADPASRDPVANNAGTPDSYAIAPFDGMVAVAPAALQNCAFDTARGKTAWARYTNAETLDTSGIVAIVWGPYIPFMTGIGGDLKVDTIVAKHIKSDTIEARHITANSITAAHIQAGSITAGKIAAGTITANEIAAGTITADKIAAGTITADRIAAGAITADKIAAGAITADKIAAGAITAGKIAAGSITATEIAAGTITGDKIQNSAITGDKIADVTITGGKIVASTITNTQVATATLTGDRLVLRTVTGDYIAETTIDSEHIQTNAVKAEHVDANAISTEKLQAGSVTAGKISVTTLSSINSNLGTITAGDITGTALHDVANKFVINLTDALATVTDSQAVPVVRMRWGKLGVGIADYGLEVYSHLGQLILGATGLGTAVVGTSNLVDAAINASKIQDNAITSGKIADLAITAAKLASDSVGDYALSGSSNFARQVQKVAATTMQGGGDITWGAGYTLTWTVRFISIPDLNGGSQYFDFGPASIVVGSWQGLYYRRPIGGAPLHGNYQLGSQPGVEAPWGWFTAQYGSYTPPDPTSGLVDYLIGVHNGDNGAFYLFDGRIIPSMKTIRGGLFIPDATIGNAHITDLSADKINAGTISAARIGARTITVDKLVVASFDNLIPDPGFETWLGTGVPTFVATQATITVTNGNGRTGGTAALQFAADAAGFRYAYPTPIAYYPVTPGENYHFSAWYKRAPGTNGTSGITVWCYDSAYGYISGFSSEGSDADNVYRQLSLSVLIPANTAFIITAVTSSHTAGTAYFDDLYLRRMTTGELVVDGTITGTKIAAATITAAHISVTSLSAIAANLGIITAGKIQNATDTVGIAISGGPNPGWLNYFDLAATSTNPILKFGALTLDPTGGGSLSDFLMAMMMVLGGE